MCCGGIRKLVFATGLALGLVAVLSYTKLGGYMKVGCNRAREAISQAVPIEIQIEALKEEVKRLTPALDKNMTTVANEQASIDRFERETNVVKESLATKKQQLLTMSNDLKSGATEFILNGKVFDRKEVEQRFSSDWEMYKRAETELKMKQQVLQTRRQKLAVAKEQLKAMRDQQAQIELQIRQLETELETVKLAETKNTVVSPLDDSKLADVKRSMADLKEQIDARRIKAEMTAENPVNSSSVGAEAPAPRPVSELIKEVREHLGEDKVSTDNTK